VQSTRKTKPRRFVQRAAVGVGAVVKNELLLWESVGFVGFVGFFLNSS
jgi:hypothetical protein